MEKLIKACVSILPKPLQKIYYKYEEKWLYVIFGGLTTVVSIVTKLLLFALVPGEPKWESTAGVVFSWICAVTFAFFTNKKYVFKNETKDSSGVLEGIRFILQCKTCHTRNGGGNFPDILRLARNEQDSHHIPQSGAHIYCKLYPEQAFCIQEQG